SPAKRIFMRRNRDAAKIECFACVVLYLHFHQALQSISLLIGSNYSAQKDVMLQIRLLGQFDIRLDGKRVTIPTRIAQSLLAYLALTAGTPHRREKLAGILWPETSDEGARKNLRQELWRVRKAIAG